MTTEHYHNSTGQDKDYVDKRKGKCKTQEEFIYNLFRAHNKMTASEVWNKYREIPLTSVRRAMSNLSRENLIQKLDEKKTGLYGAPEHYYGYSAVPSWTQSEIFDKADDQSDLEEEETQISCCGDDMIGMYEDHQICPTCKEHQ